MNHKYAYNLNSEQVNRSGMGQAVKLHRGSSVSRNIQYERLPIFYGIFNYARFTRNEFKGTHFSVNSIRNNYGVENLLIYTDKNKH